MLTAREEESTVFRMILGKHLLDALLVLSYLLRYMFNMFVICLGFAYLFVFTDVTAEFGTTPNLKQIVIRRCFEYIAQDNLNPR